MKHAFNIKASSYLSRACDLDASGLLRSTYRRSYARLVSIENIIYARKNKFKRLSYGYNEQADTCFILGSGSSVEDMSESQWSYVSSKYSVGLNLWVIHPFVPDTYSLELSKTTITTLAPYLRAGFRRRRVLDSLQTILLSSKSVSRNNLQLPNSLADLVVTYRALPFCTDSPKLLRSSIYEYFVDAISSNIPTDVLLGQFSSLFRIICYALLAGYKQIVLVGVDLNNSKTFYEVNPDHLSTLGLSSPHQFSSKSYSCIHPTSDSRKNKFTIQHACIALSSISHDLFGARLSIANRNSLLAKYLPVFRWP